MLSIKEAVWGKASVEGQYDLMILNFVASQKFVTLEMLVEAFPWMRWDELFSILSKFRKEGLMTIHHIDSLWEIRIKKQLHTKV